MNKTEFKILTISLVLTFALSAIIGVAGSFIIGSFWAWFCLSFFAQVIIFAIANSFTINKLSLEQEKANAIALEQFSKFSIKISCAYCNQYALVPIQLNQKNTFKCENCNQVNGISMQFTSTTITTPIESVTVPIDSGNSFEFKVSR